jgi:hypothetical protein
MLLIIILNFSQKIYKKVQHRECSATFLFIGICSILLKFNWILLAIVLMLPKQPFKVVNHP